MADHKTGPDSAASDLPTGAAASITAGPPAMPPAAPPGPPSSELRTMASGSGAPIFGVPPAMPGERPLSPSAERHTIVALSAPAMPTLAGAPSGAGLASVPPEMPRVLAAVSTPPARYQLGGEIARGGMGRVVDATDTTLGRVVAFKEALTTDGDSLRRFDRETMITAKLEHPSIVPVHDAGRS
ncbi:MAG TPA: hypothetical protein VFP84_40565 [Kofleriaceae bacterium]|nr:hypothetical protein [Kofleriaceae bacterium]